jgi:hypothetical protein
MDAILYIQAAREEIKEIENMEFNNGSLPYYIDDVNGTQV